MKYRALKDVTRYFGDKPGVVILKKGKLYTQEQVDRMPAYYLEEGYLHS